MFNNKTIRAYVYETILSKNLECFWAKRFNTTHLHSYVCFNKTSSHFAPFITWNDRNYSSMSHIDPKIHWILNRYTNTSPFFFLSCAGATFAIDVRPHVVILFSLHSVVSFPWREFLHLFLFGRFFVGAFDASVDVRPLQLF